jgi:hypothetical protein
MEPLHATFEEFAAEGYTDGECFCPRCRLIRLRPMNWLPRISMGLTLDALLDDFAVPSAGIRCTRLRHGGRLICSASEGAKRTRSLPKRYSLSINGLSSFVHFWSLQAQKFRLSSNLILI